MRIIAVVVTHNRLELLQQSVAALNRQEGLGGIIIVDNGSTDGTSPWLDELDGVTVVHQDNAGGSGGFYTGMKMAYDAGADWIWCMDDDVFPRRGCLAKLVECAAALPAAGILAPQRLMGGKPFTHEFRQFNFSCALASMHGKKLKVSDDFPQQPVEIAGCDFEGPFISRKVVDAIGLPNKDFFIFCDDTEYCLRAHLAGFKLYYVPGAVMDKHSFFTNDTWAERNQKKKWKRYYQVRNEAYMNHHYGASWGVRYVRSFVGMMGYCLPALITMPFSKAWRMKDLGMLWRAYTDGVRETLGKR